MKLLGYEAWLKEQKEIDKINGEDNSILYTKNFWKYVIKDTIKTNLSNNNSN